MSTEVEQRVVEMRFDNKHFESNVSTTMSTLDKLKHALRLDGASKGLENVNSAANKVNMSGLSNGVETVRAKFSALEVVAVTALANITNSAVNAGKQWVKSLSVDQVSAGWSKYGQKTSSVQTIMNATGKSIDEVNGYLEKLMWFSDETSYGFTDMTAALGQMTSAGGDIDKLIPLITGVANATAFAGKGASEFSRVMYNLNQSYSKGYLDYADWKSIDLAGVSSKQLKQMIIDVGVAQGKIKEGQITVADFASTLKDKWADTSVLEEAFGKFAEMSELAYEMVQSGEVDTASEAYEILSKKYDGVAITAAKAAQEAKTFSEAIDATKDAVSSGWMKTFEIIFGDYAEAKVLWTDLANTLWDVFAAGAEVRNWVLETALNFAEPWQAIEEKLGNVTKAINKVKDATDTLSYFQEVVSKVWRGDYNNQGDNPDRRDLLKAAGYDARVVQDLVNKGSRYQLTVEDIKASHEKFGLSLATSTEETEELTKKLEDLDKETLKNLGLTEDEIELYKALAKEAKRTGKSINEIADNMSKNNGRTLLIDSFKNFGSVILDTIQIIKDAMAEIFEIPTAADMVIKLHNMITALHKFSERIRLTNKETGDLTETGKKFLSIFKGIFASIDIAITILKGPLKLAFSILKEILSIFGTSILDILAKVGEGFVKLRDVVDKVVGTLTKFIVKHVSKWIEKFKETEFFKTIADWFAKASERISGALGSISNNLDKFGNTGIGKALKSVISFLSAIVKSVANSKVVRFAIDGIRIAFEKLKGFFTGFKLPELSIDNLKMFFTNFSNLGKNIAASDKGGVAGVIDGIGKTLSGHTSLTKAKTNFQNGVESFFTGFVNFWLKIGDGLKKAFKICQEALKGIVKFIFGTEEVDLPTIMDAVEKFLWILTLLKAIQMMDSFVAPFENITSALDNIANSLKWKAIASAFKAMALALGVLTVCILVLSGIEDMKKAWQAVGMLAGLLIVMGGVIAALGWLSGKMGGLDVKGVFGISLSLLMLIGAVALMVKTLKDFDNLKLKDPLKTFGYLAATLVAMYLGVKLVSKAGSANFSSIAGLLTMVAALKLILEVITAYDEYDWFGKTRAIKRMGEMLVMLSLAVNIATRGVKAGSNIKGLAFIILAMVVSLKILVSVIEDFAAMENDVLKKGITVVAILMGLMTGLMAVANLTSKGTVLKKGQRNVNNFTGFAIALLTVVAAIWLLGKMDRATLEQGGLMVSIVLGMMTGVLALLGKNCKGLKTQPIIAMIVGFALILAELAFLIKWLDDISVESKISSVVALGGMLLAMAGVLKILSKSRIKAKNIYKWLGALAVLGLIAAELALILYAIKDMNPLSAVGNALALATLLTAMSGVLYILSGLDMRKLSNKKLTKLAVVFGVMGVILAELALVLLIIKNVHPANAIANATALTLLLSAIAGVLYVISTIKYTNNITKVILAMAGLGVLVAGLAGILYAIRDINPTTSVANATALSELLIVMTGVMAACAALGKTVGNNIKGFYVAVSGIAALGLVVGELAAVLKYTKDLDPQTSVGNARALEELMVVLTGVMTACGLLSSIVAKNAKGFWIAAGGIASLGLVVGELGGILSLIKKWDMSGMEDEVKVIANLMIALTGVLAACAIIGLVMTSMGWIGIAGAGIAIGSISVLGLIVLELGWVISVIKKLKIGGMESQVKLITNLLYDLVKVLAACTILGLGAAFATGAILNLAALGLVFLELGAVVKAIKKMKIKNTQKEVKIITKLLNDLVPILESCTILGIAAPAAAAGVAAMALLGTVVLELGVVLAIIKDFDIGNMLPTVITLSLLLNNLVPILEACTVLGFAAPAAGGGVAALSLLGTVVLELGAFLALMKDWDIGTMLPTVIVLSLLLNNLIPVLEACTILGFGAPAALGGIGALVTLIGALEGVIIALGALTEIPGFKKFINNGISMFEKLAHGIGSIISNFTSGLTSCLPEIGENLSSFATNVKTFLDVINTNIKDDTITKAGKFAGIIAAFLGIGMADSLNLFDLLKKMFGGQSSLESLGTKLSNFGNNIGGFIEAMNSIKPETASSMESFATAMKLLNDVCGNNNFGDGELENLGKQSADFAESMKTVSESLSDLTDDDVANVKRAAEAAEALAKLNDCIPGTGFELSLGTSLGDSLNLDTGKQTIDEWGKRLEAFAECLVNFSIKVSGNNIDVDAIKNSAEAAKALTEVNKAIPKAGGGFNLDVKSLFGDELHVDLGEQDIEEWGKKIAAFADSLITYNNKIANANINVEAIKTSAAAAKALAEVTKELDKEGGAIGLVTGEVNLEKFGTGLTYLATGLVDYTTIASAITEDDVTNVKNTKDVVTELQKVVNEISKTGGLASWLGEHDAEKFGAGLSALAKGIGDMCETAASITKDDINAITNEESGLTAAVDKLKSVVNIIPTDFSSTPATQFKSAVTAVHNVCKEINTISTAGYDYSGIETVKGAISNLETIITSESAKILYDDANTLLSTSYSIQSIAVIIDNLKDKSYTGVTLFNNALDNLSQAKIQDVIDTFSGKVTSFKDAVGGIVKALEESLYSDTSKTALINAMLELINSGLDALKSEDTLSKASTAGSNLASKVASGANSETAKSAAETAGKNLGAGYIKGIEAYSKGTRRSGSKAYNAGYNLGAQAAAGINKGQKSNSPSKLAEQSGKWLGEGYIIGVDKMGRLVGQAGDNLGKTATDSMSYSISKISDMIGNDIDSQPTIRPVLDLSDVKSGVSTIGSMLNLDSSVGVRANVGAISASMANRQNGNDELISAIDKLAKSSDKSGDNYYFNGFSYNESSDVADAIKTLVRAAIIEGRT